MLKTTAWWCDLSRTGRTRRSSPKKPMMSSTGGGRLDGQLYVFAAEDGVDTTWCRGAINSEREVARFWRLLKFGMEENIRDLRSSLEMLVCRGIRECAGRRAGRQSCCCKGITPAPGCWSTGWINGWSRTGSECRAGRRDEASKKSWEQGQRSQRSQHSAGSRTDQHENRHRRRRVL